MACCGWACSLAPWTDWIERRAKSPITFPADGDENTLGAGTNVNSIYRDAAGDLWVGGGGSGLERFDERTGRFKRYRHDRRDPRSLISDNVYTIYGDRSGQMWVGLEGGISRFDPATDRFVNYRPVPDDPASLANTVWMIYQDRSGALWARYGTSAARCGLRARRASSAGSSMPRTGAIPRSGFSVARGREVRDRRGTREQVVACNHARRGRCRLRSGAPVVACCRRGRGAPHPSRRWKRAPARPARVCRCHEPARPLRPALPRPGSLPSAARSCSRRGGGPLDAPRRTPPAIRVAQRAPTTRPRRRRDSAPRLPQST